VDEEREDPAEHEGGDDLAAAGDAAPLEELRDDEHVRDRDEEAVADDGRGVLERVLVMDDEGILARLEERAAERVHEEREDVRDERDEQEERGRPLFRERGRAIAIRAEPRESGRKSFLQRDLLSD
jgi:hypothetical protein